jgi:undecaprenyl-diphosphatase
VHHLLDTVMIGASEVGRFLLWLALALLGVGLRRVPGKAACQLCLAMLLTFLINDITLKPVFHAPRPFQRDVLARVVGPRPTDYSFPSGHAAASFGAAVALSRGWPGGTIVWFALAAFISYTRVYLGVHYPVDVVCGAVVGIACGWLAVGRTRWHALRAPTANCQAPAAD